MRFWKAFALAQLRHGSQAEIKVALDQLSVDSAASTVSIRWELSDEAVLQLGEKLHELRQQARAPRRARTPPRRQRDASDKPAESKAVSPNKSDPSK